MVYAMWWRTRLPLRPRSNKCDSDLLFSNILIVRLVLFFTVAQAEVAGVVPAPTAPAIPVPATQPVLEIGFCGSAHDSSWPAVVALTRKAIEAGKPLVPLPPAVAGMQLKWNLVFANTTAGEIASGYMQMLGNRLRGVSENPVDAIVGCTYSPVSEKVAALASLLQVPMVSWISKATSLSSKLEFPYFLRTCATSQLFGESFVAVSIHFDWRTVGYLYEGYSAAQTGFDGAIDMAHGTELNIVGFSFFHYPDADEVLHQDWANRMKAAKVSDIRAFGICFSSPKVPEVMRIALETGMNKRLLIQWEFANIFTSEGLSREIRKSFEGMIGLAESQSRPPYEAAVEEVWRSMDFDQLVPLGIPENFVTAMRKGNPNLFQKSPFFYNHAQLIDAISAVVMAFSNMVADDPALGEPGTRKGDKLRAELYRTNFSGLSGKVSFSSVFDGKGGDRFVSHSSLYEARRGQIHRIGHVIQSKVDLEQQPRFPDGNGNPRNYDKPVHCGPDQMSRIKDGRRFCTACPFVLAAQCIPLAVFAGLIAVPFLLLLLIIYAWAMRARHNDSFWLVKLSQLKFSDPPEKLGQGTFGYVLKAEYRGTEVAVKLVLPPIDKLKQTSLFSCTGAGNSQCITGGSTTDEKDKVARPESGQWQSVAQNAVEFPADCGVADVNLESGCGGARYPERKVTVVDAVDDSDGVDDDDFGSLMVGMSPSSSSSASHTSDTDDSRHDRSPVMQFSVKSGRSKSTFLRSLANDLTMSSFFRSSIRSRRAQMQRDFIQEMRVLAKLRHPCIVTVMGAVISSKSEPMLVMEFMDNGSLRQLLQNDTLPLDELAAPMLQDIAQGMRFLHNSDPVIIHSDLKTPNVLVDARFRAKIADFGLTIKRKVQWFSGPTGTPPSMAPELLRGGCNTKASDMFAFGVLLFEVQTREEPYLGQNISEVLAEVACQDLENSRRPSIPPTTPVEMAVLMKDCWRSDPALRPCFEEVDRRLKSLEFGSSGREERRRRTDNLLFDVFPRHVAEALRDGRKVEPEHRDVVTIFFSDIVGFTDISSTLEPHKVSSMLDRLYSQFDSLSTRTSIFKVETIGDAYMAVANLVEDQQADHARRIVYFAANAVRAAQQCLIDLDDASRGFVNIRVGFHSGPVVANVVGTRNPRYCLFGDTVNTASRMESNSERNRVHCSVQAAAYVRTQAPEVLLNSRGEIPIKGKGCMETFWVEVPNPLTQAA